MAGMFEHGASTDKASTASFKSQLNKVYGWYAGGFIGFVQRHTFTVFGYYRIALGLLVFLLID